MINEARNWLFNRVAPAEHVTQQPGEEFIPAEFQPLRVFPEYLRQVRRVLFSCDPTDELPDREFTKYRVWQLLQLLHTPECLPYVLQLDKRITYDLQRADYFRWRLARQLPQVESPHPSLLSLINVTAPPAQHGRSLYRWYVQQISGTVTIVPLLPSQQIIRRPYLSDGAGLSQIYDLPNAELKFRLVPYRSAWLITQYRWPQESLGHLLQELRALPGEYLVRLFRRDTADSQREPYATWYRWWADAEQPFNLPLAAATLAYIYNARETDQAYRRDSVAATQHGARASRFHDLYYDLYYD